MEKEQLNELIKQIQKKFGKESIINMNDSDLVIENSISTGIKTFDYVLGIGGFPKGRIIELFGPESSGKTTLALKTASQVQKNGGIVAFIDAEHALDIEHAKKIGVKTKDLIVSQPDYGEQALELINYLCNFKNIDLIIVDSVASLIPKAELDGEVLDQNIGLQARMMSKAMRLLSTSASKSNTTIIFINQLREKVGIIFGNPEITPGGRSLKFYSSIRAELRIKEKIKKNNQIIGQRILFKVIKNKMAPPYKDTEINYYYDTNFDLEEDYVNFLLKKGELEQKGSWIYKDGKAIAQSKKDVFKTLNLLID